MIDFDVLRKMKAEAVMERQKAKDNKAQETVKAEEKPKRGRKKKEGITDG